MQQDIIILFQSIEDKLNTAYETNDAEQVARLLSPDWTMLEPGFGLVAKTDFIKAIKEGRLIHSLMKKEVKQVKVINDIAIVISRGRNTGMYAGKAFDTWVWVTNIYRQQDREWICIATQESPIPCTED